MATHPTLQARLAAATLLAWQVVTHEATHHHPLGTPARFVAWQLGKRLWHHPITVTAFGDMQLRCYPTRHASNDVVYYGWPDWAEMHLLARLLRPGDGFLDVGANVGSYTLLAWSRVRPGGRVLAFEPDPQTAKILRENASLNGLRETAVVEAAVGAVDGQVRFRTGRDTLGRVATNGTAGRRVRLARLDSVVTEPGRFVAGKMDIEGYELAALEGAEQLLAAHAPPCWLLEMNRESDAFGVPRAAIEAHLARFGYDLYAVHGDGDRLARLPLGGPYPANVLAVADLALLRRRIPGLRVD